MSGIATILSSGLQLHLAGRLTEAEQVYRQALTMAPNEAHAWYLLGTLQHQQGAETWPSNTSVNGWRSTRTIRSTT